MRIFCIRICVIVDSQSLHSNGFPDEQKGTDRFDVAFEPFGQTKSVFARTWTELKPFICGSGLYCIYSRCLYNDI